MHWKFFFGPQRLTCQKKIKIPDKKKLCEIMKILPKLKKKNSGNLAFKSNISKCHKPELLQCTFSENTDQCCSENTKND